MDPALVDFDFAKAGAILADMVASYLAAGAPPFNPEGADDDEFEDCRSTPGAAGLHLHPPVDDGTGSLQPGKHGAPIQSEDQGQVTRLEAGADPHPRPGSRPIRERDDQSGRLQGLGRRSGYGTGWRNLFLGSVAASAIEPGLASPPGALRHHQHARDRRGRLLQSGRVQRWACIGDEGYVRPSGIAIIRARLHGGKLNKASKGELRFPLPVGFVFEGDKITIDPDREVQGAVRTVFDLFARENTAFGVVRRYNDWIYASASRVWRRVGRQTSVGQTDPFAGPRHPCQSVLRRAYVFGRHQSSKEVGSSGEIRTRSRLMPQDAWRVVIPDHHEGYISADQFIANRRRPSTNRTNAEGLSGPAERASASCRACSSAGFADAVSGFATPGTEASTRSINVFGNIGRPWRPVLV